MKSVSLQNEINDEFRLKGVKMVAQIHITFFTKSPKLMPPETYSYPFFGAHCSGTCCTTVPNTYIIIKLHLKVFLAGRTELLAAVGD